MRKILLLSSLFVLFAGAFSNVSAQVKIVVGEVTSVDTEKIVLKTDSASIDAILLKNTEFKRLSPENPSLKAAVASTFEEVGVGDKVAVTGKYSDDSKSFTTYRVYLMTKSSIVQKNAKESEEWKTRGIMGKVEEVNAQTNQITISSRGVLGETKTILTPKEGASFRRYAPDSIKYSEAVESSIADVKTGDMIRALGDKSADATTFAAEELISGAFQTTAGTITAINPDTNEVTINNISTKKDVIVVVGKASTIKEFPAEVAQRLARIQMMQAAGLTPGGRQGGNRPGGSEGRGNDSERKGEGGNRAGGGEGRGEGRPGGGREMRGGGSIDEMLERFPDISVTDLKVGQMIAVSSTKTENAERITAIKLLSGVEPFLTQPQAASGGRGGNRQGGQSSGFSIPGLDEGGGVSIP